MTRQRKGTCMQCAGVAHLRARGLCAVCLTAYRRQHDRDRIGTRDQSHYGSEWRRLSRSEIQRHISIHGYTCPRCNDADVERNPLSLDHVKARSLDEGVAVLCRRCNSAKSDRR